MHNTHACTHAHMHVHTGGYYGELLPSSEWKMHQDVCVLASFFSFKTDVYPNTPTGDDCGIIRDGGQWYVWDAIRSARFDSSGGGTRIEDTRAVYPRVEH